jgi:hypothetical protein
LNKTAAASASSRWPTRTTTPAQGSATMLFQPELVFEGVDDRLDPLAHPTQRSEPIRLVLAVWADEVGPQRSDVLFEGSTGESLVGQDDRARGQGLLASGVLQQRLGDLAFPEPGGGQTPGDRHAVWRAEQVQLETPVPAAVLRS